MVKKSCRDICIKTRNSTGDIFGYFRAAVAVPYIDKYDPLMDMNWLDYHLINICLMKRVAVQGLRETLIFVDDELSTLEHQPSPAW